MVNDYALIDNYLFPMHLGILMAIGTSRTYDFFCPVRKDFHMDISVQKLTYRR